MALAIQQHHAESIHYLVDTKIYRDRTSSCLKSRLPVILTFMELKFTTSGENTNVWVVIHPGPNRYVDELRYKDPEYSPRTSKKLIMEACRKLMRNNRLFNRDLNAVHSMTTFRLTKENGKTSLPMRTATNMSWDTISQNLLENWYVPKIAVTEAGGAIHWRLIRQKLKLTFTKQGGDIFTDRDRISHTWKRGSKSRFQFYPNSFSTLIYIRAIEGHTGRIEPELMGHVATPFNWKPFLFHRACSLNLKSILEAGLVAR